MDEVYTCWKRLMFDDDDGGGGGLMKDGKSNISIMVE